MLRSFLPDTIRRSMLIISDVIRILSGVPDTTCCGGESQGNSALYATKWHLIAEFADGEPFASRSHRVRARSVREPSAKSTAKIRKIFDICNTLSPNSRHLSPKLCFRPENECFYPSIASMLCTFMCWYTGSTILSLYKKRLKVNNYRICKFTFAHARDIYIQINY